jgi:hypothetical protein
MSVKMSVDSNHGTQPSFYAVNAFNKWLGCSFVLLMFAVGMVIAPTASAGQSTITAKQRQLLASQQAPIEVIRDQHGDALRTSNGAFTSTNWSGYVLPKFETGETYTSAQATWEVPQVTWDGAPSISANWVGIGGFCKSDTCKKVDNSLIQLGTAQESLNPVETDYFAWYEMLPKASFMTTLTVNPGDVITASLTCAGKCKGTQHWTLSMTDETSGQSWSHEFKYSSSKLSTEWIEEAPSTQEGIVPLADFDTTTFVASMVDGGSANLSAGDSIEMNDPNGQLSTVSAPDSTMDGFTACFDTTSCSFVPII